MYVNERLCCKSVHIKVVFLNKIYLTSEGMNTEITILSLYGHDFLHDIQMFFLFSMIDLICKINNILVYNIHLLDDI